jgi:osmotically-inducible protein OsmY
MMNISAEKRIWSTGTYLGLLAFGLAAGSAVHAQNVPPAAGPVSIEAPMGQSALAQRVETALQASPYFYDRHVTVSAGYGGVVLSGFVFSDWDLRDALRLARQAAGDRPVIDNLSIKEGGNR